MIPYAFWFLKFFCWLLLYMFLLFIMLFLSFLFLSFSLFVSGLFCSFPSSLKCIAQMSFIWAISFFLCTYLPLWTSFLGQLLWSSISFAMLYFHFFFVCLYSKYLFSVNFFFYIETRRNPPEHIFALFHLKRKYRMVGW